MTTGSAIRGGVIAIIAFVIVLTVISTSVTGTDTGSTLVKDLGPLIAGFVALLALLGGIGFGRRG